MAIRFEKRQELGCGQN